MYIYFNFKAKHAQDIGADAIACMAPSYFKPETIGRYREPGRVVYNVYNFLEEHLSYVRIYQCNISHRLIFRNIRRLHGKSGISCTELAFPALRY